MFWLTAPGFANSGYLCMSGRSATDLFGKSFICMCLGFCHTCCVRLLVQEWSVSVQTVLGEKIACSNYGSRTWDLVESYCWVVYWTVNFDSEDLCVECLCSLHFMLKVVKFQELSRIWYHNWTCVNILGKLQTAALNQVEIFNVHETLIGSSFCVFSSIMFMWGSVIC